MVTETTESGCFDTLARRHWGQLRHWALWLCDNEEDAEDLLSVSLIDAFRCMVLNRREAGDLAAAYAAAIEGLRFYPNDPVCRGFLEGRRAAAPEAKGVD